MIGKSRALDNRSALLDDKLPDCDRRCSAGNLVTKCQDPAFIEEGDAENVRDRLQGCTRRRGCINQLPGDAAADSLRLHDR